MDNKNHFFLYGGVYSFGLSILIAVLLFIVMKQNQKPTYYSITDDPVMSVSVEMKDDKKTQKYLEDITKQMKQDGEAAVEKQEDIESLFDEIKTESIIYSKETEEKKEAEIDPEFLKKLQLRKKVKPSTKGSTVTEHLKLKEAEATLENIESKQAKSGEKNEYYVKVHDILYAHWHTNVLKETARVKITISPSGRFAYTVKQWSGSEQFNKELQIHLDYLMEVTFPLPPSGNSVTLDINFISKENSD